MSVDEQRLNGQRPTVFGLLGVVALAGLLGANCGTGGIVDLGSPAVGGKPSAPAASADPLTPPSLCRVVVQKHEITTADGKLYMLVDSGAFTALVTKSDFDRAKVGERVCSEKWQ